MLHGTYYKIASIFINNFGRQEFCKCYNHLCGIMIRYVLCREMVESIAIAQWLKKRHVLPFRDPDMLFAGSSDSEATSGVVKAVLENPVYEAKMRPPEDNLVISFNNPLFKPTNPTNIAIMPTLANSYMYILQDKKLLLLPQ